MSSATGTAGVEIFVTCNGSDQLNGYNLKITWDPAVMNVTAVTDYAGLGQFYNPPVPVTNGIVYVQDFSGSKSVTGNQTLLSLTCNALVHDGTSTAIAIDGAYANHEVDEKVGGDVTGQYSLVPGTFTTTDYTSPAITISSPADGATVAQSVTVVADITDVGGVNVTSIAVSVGGEQADTLNTVAIAGGYRVTATKSGVAIGTNVPVAVSASDLTGNIGTRIHYVTVAQSGVTITAPADGNYTNQAQPPITAAFVQVNQASVKMFLNNVDVTTDCTVSGGATDGAIALNYASYGVLADNTYVVVVNGTSSLDASQQSATVTFTKDTTAPVVTITGIQDSDGDGFVEANENLIISYTVTDANFKQAWVETVTNTTNPGMLFLNTAPGNRNLTVSAVDLAGNQGQSAQFHLYNNYLAYYNDASLGTFAGIDLSKTAIFNYFDVARAITLTGPNTAMTFPTFGTFTKTIVPGSNATLDNRKNDPITAGELPAAIKIYATPTGSLDFTIQVPDVDNATIMIGKANSTLLDQMIRNPSSTSPSAGTLQELLSQDKIVLYGKGGGQYGYGIISVANDGSITILKQEGTISASSNLMSAIRSNYLNLDAGFNSATATGITTPLQISDLGAGEYVVLAVCVDQDRFSIITMETFQVAASGQNINPSASSYTIGSPVVVTAGSTGQNIAALLINRDATYTGAMALNLTTLGTGSLEDVRLYANGNTTVEKLISNIYITPGYGKYGTATNSSTVQVATSGLVAGNYYLYMFTENNGNMTLYNQASISLVPVTPPTPTPTPYTPSGGGGGGGGSSRSVVTYEGSGVVSTSSSGIVTKTIAVVASDESAKLTLQSGVRALDADGNPISSITIERASDAPAAPAGALFSVSGYVYECGPAGATFNPGMTLTATLSEEDWNAMIASGQVPTFKWYNAETDAWEDVPTTVNAATRTVTATVTHFSMFAVVYTTGVLPTATPTEVVTATPTEVTPTTPAQPTEELPFMMIIIAIVAIIVVAGAAFFYMKKDN
ncbi:hypothetical protein ABH15_07915 [Methanoculleus taiwanensis]|uniref:Uncharacterized protein n=1 Tax=Methanoculleus taiwanensis TaxID=1550565 RepID=A0A498H161_9EURY|nr:hypothetical protein [Methanoculleus taiwanensis]RXE56097.1 hypothetical protein ABH15_07915 [Methanoculleus taiwanensis]